MSTGIMLGDRKVARPYHVVNDGDHEGCIDGPVTAAVDRLRGWLRTDTVLELIDVLMDEGRTREARAVESVLGYDDDEASMRAFVSRQWAADWDSPEDAAYDEL